MPGDNKKLLHGIGDDLLEFSLRLSEIGPTWMPPSHVRRAPENGLCALLIMRADQLGADRASAANHVAGALSEWA